METWRILFWVHQNQLGNLWKLIPLSKTIPTDCARFGPFIHCVYDPKTTRTTRAMLSAILLTFSFLDITGGFWIWVATTKPAGRTQHQTWEENKYRKWGKTHQKQRRAEVILWNSNWQGKCVDWLKRRVQRNKWRSVGKREHVCTNPRDLTISLSYGKADSD